MQTEDPQTNPGQQQVYDHESGPLLVVAGAGTGKTSTIIKKINKLLDSGIAPASILAVTFTEKAAAEMLDRVLSSRGGLLPEMPIMTFNGFGDSLLREFSVDLGIPRSFDLLSTQAQIIFMRERIDEFGLEYFMPLSGSPDGIIEDILGLFSQLKQHIITPDTYTEYAANMPADDEAEALEKRKHQELAKAFAVYTRLCRTENVIDYDDQIYLTIQLLEQRPNIRKLLQQRYHTIFVDEFQDTNPMQSRLIDLLANEQNNLIVVGDDDQSIYGFRGATLANILEFKDRYPNAAEAALIINYRSFQSILDASYNLIQYNNPHRLESSLGINKRLTSDRPGQDPQLQRFVSVIDEYEWLAADIARRIEAGENPGSIAVLTRSNPIANQVHQALRAAGVVHRVVGANPDLYTRPIVRMLTELVRTLAEPANNASLHHTLVGGLFEISNELVGPLAARARHEHEALEVLLTEQTETAEAMKLIKSWRSEAATSPVGILLWQAIKESGYLDKLKTAALNDDIAANTISHLKQYFDSLKEFENIAVQPTCTQYLLSLPALQAAGEASDGTMDITDSEVIVTTVHKAKGLEWDTVYIPNLTEGSFPWFTRGGGLRLPEALCAVSASPADEHYAEERRLMYVAITRARHNVILSYSDTGKSGTARRPSRFIDEIFGSGTAASAPHTDVTTGQQSLLDIPVDTVPRVSVPATIFDGKTVRLSVSQALALLDCPRNFYYKFILHTPEEPTPKTGYGSQLHEFFEEINRGRIDNSLRPLEDILADLESGWQKSGYASRDQQVRALAQAKRTLSEFYNSASISRAPLYVEEPFECLLNPESIELRGRFDVVVDNDGIEIRDYKTGNKVTDQDKANKRAGASSQLTMYALAWQLQHGEIPARLSLQFVDTGFIGSVRKTQRGIDGLRARLQKACDDLRQGNFPLGSKHDYCIHPPIE